MTWQPIVLTAFGLLVVLGAYRVMLADSLRRAAAGDARHAEDCARTAALRAAIGRERLLRELRLAACEQAAWRGARQAEETRAMKVVT